MSRIAIIGGGLGGMATAVALQRKGFDVHIFERAAVLAEVGAGIQISPNAVQALDGIGIGEDIRAIGNERRSTVILDIASGSVLNTIDQSAIASRHGAPFLAFHRADLLAGIAQHVEPPRIHLDHNLSEIIENAEAVTLRFSNGTSFDAEAVIGADGVRSVVREYLWGEDDPEFTGQVAVRAIIPGNSIKLDVLTETTGPVWVGAGMHFVVYHLRGQDLINIVIRSESAEWVEEGWSVPTDPDELRARYDAQVEPRLRALLGEIKECFNWGIFAREPSANWGRGRLQLIGDAAHPMVPDAAQGASQAFEDAYVLSMWLSEHRHDLQSALAGYEKARKNRAHRVQRQALLNTRRYHASNELDEGDGRFASAAQKRSTVIDDLSWIYDYDPIRQWNEVPS